MEQTADNRNAPRRSAGRRGSAIVPGEELYLWTLVALEVTALVVLRRVFSRRHGG